MGGLAISKRWFVYFCLGVSVAPRGIVAKRDWLEFGDRFGDVEWLLMDFRGVGFSVERCLGAIA